MKKSSLTLSILSLSLASVFNIQPINAALPFSIGQKEQVTSISSMLEKVTPAVVNIYVEGIQKQDYSLRLPEQFQFFFGPNLPFEQTKEEPFKGLGSGVIIDSQKGYIVTNYHVIKNANDIKVQLQDGKEYQAKLIGGDELSDVALLQLNNATSLVQLKIADSDELKVGDFVVAIGNPFGLGQTVTSGIISALGRSGLNLENLENFIQTDAAINSGNSGGALINLRGELIGINTAILGPNGGNVGIGFAIPSNMVKNLTDQIIEFGEIKRGVLGVQGGEITPELAKAMGYKENTGAFVNQVIADSAAEKAGLKAGDIIISLNNKSIASFAELRAKIATLGAGKKIKLTVIRGDGKVIDFDVTLEQAKEAKAKAETIHNGLTGAELSNTTADDNVTGVIITSVKKDSLAAQYQLQKNDIIIGVNRQPVANIAELREVIEKTSGILALNIIRDNREIYIVVR